MSNSYDGLAKMLVLNVGGKDNVTSVSHCDTRLRFVLKDEGQANTDLIRSLDGVVSVVKEDGQYQIVIGNHVPDVYERVLVCGNMRELGTTVSEASKASSASASSLVMAALFVAVALAVSLAFIFAFNEPLAVALPVALVCALSSAIIYKRAAGEPSARQGSSQKGDAASKVQPEKLLAPVKGRLIPLNEISDEAFASGILGEGVGLMPEEGRIYSPCGGVITTFFPTGHAIGIRSDSGAEILIHIGINTVKLDGKGFYPKKQQGDRTNEGELLLEFDLDVIKGADMSCETPMIVTNKDAYSRITVAREGMADHGDVVIETVPK